MFKTLYPHVPRIVEMGLLCVASFWLFTMIFPNSSADQALAVMNNTSSEKDPLVNIKDLTDVPLFGKLESKPVVHRAAAIPQPAETSRLDIKLLGTIVAGEQSAAVMTVGTSAETLFYLGDPLYGRVVLKKVEADAVILNNQGNDERITLIEGKAMAGGRISSPRTVYQAVPATVYEQPSALTTSQGIPPGVMNQRMPPGVMNQGMPPGVMNQGMPPG